MTTSLKDSSWPSWVFDDSPIEDTFGYGQRAVDAIRVFKHPISGKRFDLDPWMERIVRRIYGPCHPNGHRVVRSVVIMLPRGARKTTLGAVLALLHSIGPEKRPYGQAIACAYDRDQARIAFEEAVGMIDMDKRLRQRVTIVDSRHRFKHKIAKSSFRAVSSDAKARNGATPAFCLFDEVHCWPSRQLYDVMRTGLGKTKNTLSVVISQAGRGAENVGAEIFGYARQVASGEVEDPGTLPILLETPKDSDWQDEELWHRVNPGLALGYPDIESLRQEAKEAVHRPHLRDKFRNDHLNIWLDTSASPFIDMSEWDACGADFDIETLKHCNVWLGVDCSTVRDLSVVTACFRDGNTYKIHSRYFCPADNLEQKSEKEGVPYVHWKEAGYITPTPGAYVDHTYIERYIREFCERFPKTKEIAFDQTYAGLMIASLQKSHHPAITMRQGWVTQSPALNRLESAIIGRKLQHDRNPILRWNFENAEVHTDSNGNRTLEKSLTTRKIDGCFSTWMAHDRASFGQDARNIYASGQRRGFATVKF